MSEFSVVAIQAHVHRLLPEFQQSGRSAEDAGCAVMSAVLVWMEDQPAPTDWLTYEVDGHKFFVRRNIEGRVVTGNEL